MSNLLTGYLIERNTGPGWMTLVADNGLVTSYDDTDAFGGTNQYRVTSIGSVSNSVPSNIATAVESGPGQIVGYKVERATDPNGTWTTITANSGSATPSYDVSGLTNATLYYFRVSAIRSDAVVGSVSAYATATTGTVAPQPPTALLASTIDRTTALLVWTAPTITGGDALDHYRIDRSYQTGGGISTTVLTTADTSVAYLDSGLDSGVTYTWKVYAVSAAGTGGPSNPLVAQTAYAASASCAMAVLTAMMQAVIAEESKRKQDAAIP